MYESLVTRSRTKKLQQEVHAFLSELHFDINETVILSKSSTLLLLRFSHEEATCTSTLDAHLSALDPRPSTSDPRQNTLGLRSSTFLLIPDVYGGHQVLDGKLVKSILQHHQVKYF